MSPRPLSRSIEAHLVPWRERDWPIDWGEVFGRRGPLALEIGFGNGEFLAREAGRRPERDHVGIEVSWTSARHLFRRLDGVELGNVRVLLGDAQVALRLLFEPESLAEAFIHHPCPWPKDRHEGRRLIRPAFVALLADRLVEGAKVTIVTDHPAYADEIAAVLEAQSELVSCHGETRVHELPGREPTKYQRKAMAAGAAIHYFEWRKVAAPAHVAAPPSLDPLEGMLSLILGGDFDADGLFAGFAPVVHREQEDGVAVLVKLRAAYRWEGGKRPRVWLVVALVREDDLQQEFALLVVERSGGKLLVKLSDLGRPRPTFGVKRAVWCVGRWLASRSPGLEVIDHNLGERAGGKSGAG